MVGAGIYTGTLRHRRFQPTRHEFSYPVFLAYLDIDRIGELMRVSRLASYNRWNWAAFDERDHFGDARLPLRRRLEIDAAENGLTLPDGPVYLLTNLRYLGYNFNPISLFYCYDRAGRVRAVMAEVKSTFGESHNYWLTDANALPGAKSLRYQCAKRMHVSPFMPMELAYRFALTEPAEQLVAHIDTLEQGVSFFDATLNLEWREWSAASLRGALVAHPWMTAKVIAAIHWQALRLYLKRVPYFPQVKKQVVETKEIEVQR